MILPKFVRVKTKTTMPTPEPTETMMDIGQQSFFAEHVGQEAVAGIIAHLFAVAHKVSSTCHSVQPLDVRVG